jgi:hypothetical protein
MSHADTHVDDVWGPDPPPFRAQGTSSQDRSDDLSLVPKVDAVPVAGDQTVEPDASEDQDVAEIRDEIEQTRAELSDTIDQIQERLNPQYLVEEARDAVKTATIGKAERMVSNVTDSARGAGSSFMDTIRENPLPAAMAGLGLGWLFMRRSSRSNNGSYYAGNYKDYERDVRDFERRGGAGYASGYGYATGTPRDYPPRYRGPSAYYGTRSDESGGMVERVQDKAGEVVDQARERVGDVADQARERMGDAAERAGHLMGNAGHTTRAAGSGFMDVVRNNPVPAAIAAVSLGWLFMNRDTDDGSYYAGSYRDYERHLKDFEQRRGTYPGDESSREGVRGMLDRAGDLGDDAGQQVRRARGQIDRWMDEAPLAVGAVALGLGAAAGLAAPSTRQEGQLMGDMRERFMDKVQEVAQDAQTKVQRVVGEVQETASTAAKDQNLTV